MTFFLQGTLELLFDKGSTKKIYLHRGPPAKVPVPEYFWKVIIDTVSKQAVAFIGFNNPYLTKTELITRKRRMCKDVFHKLPKSLKFSGRTNIPNGYILCCEVNDKFRTIVNEFLDPTNYPILKSIQLHHYNTLFKRFIKITHSKTKITSFII